VQWDDADAELSAKPVQGGHTPNRFQTALESDPELVQTGLESDPELVLAKFRYLNRSKIAPYQKRSLANA